VQKPSPGLALASALFFVVVGFAERSIAGKSDRRADAYQYGTSVACGTDSGGVRGIAGGVYATSVALLDPGSRPATIQATLALSQRIGDSEPGPVSSPLAIALDPGHALELACDEIANDFVFATPRSASEPISGFLALESDGPLEAQSSFAETTTSGSEASLEVVSLAERRVPARPPRVVPRRSCQFGGCRT